MEKEEKEKNKVIKENVIKNKIKEEKPNSDNGKSQYENIDKMKDYLKDCVMFNENFEVVKYINSGSEGIFYEGKIKAINKKIGIKFILNQKKEKQNYKEVRLHNSLKHKNITNLYGYFSLKEGSSCIIMEYGKYGDLKNFQRNMLKKRCISETMLCYVSRQILDGLKYCHDCKIAHMDIKPQNILVDESLNIKLTDFSVSINYELFSDNDEINLPFVGTTLYMAPEVLRGLKITIKEFNKVDSYSLGVLIFNMAFSQYPYNLSHEDSKDTNKIFEKIKIRPLIFPEDSENPFSNKFKDFVSKLLCPNCNKRISINDALEHPWIKGADLLFDEKEKLSNLEKFVIYLLSDNFIPFNNYINDDKK